MKLGSFGQSSPQAEELSFDVDEDGIIGREQGQDSLLPQSDGLPNTSPVPTKDYMGMDYLPVYENETKDEAGTDQS